MACLLSCGGPGSDGVGGTFLQFERAATVDPSQFAGSAVGLVFGDRFFSTTDGSLYEVKESGATQVEGYRSAFVSVDGATLYASKADGSLWKTADVATWTQVTAGPYAAYGLTTERLLAVQRVSFGIGTLLESKDAGATWSPIGEVKAGYEIGTSDGFSISAVAGTRARVTAQVQDAQPGITYAASQVYLLDGGSLSVVGIYRKNDPVFAPPFPRLVTRDGVAVFTDRDTPNLPSDATSLVLLSNPGATPVLASGKRLRWATPALVDAFTEVTPLGFDSTGRLVVVSAAGALRTVKPLTAGADDSATIFAGPGCGDRNSFGPDVGSNPRPEGAFRNESGKAVLVRWIDAQYRWFKLGTVEAGGSLALSSTNAQVTHGLLVTDPATDACLLFTKLQETGDVTLR